MVLQTISTRRRAGLSGSVRAAVVWARALRLASKCYQQLNMKTIHREGFPNR